MPLKGTALKKQHIFVEKIKEKHLMMEEAQAALDKPMLRKK